MATMRGSGTGYKQTPVRKFKAARANAKKADSVLAASKKRSTSTSQTAPARPRPKTGYKASRDGLRPLSGTRGVPKKKGK